MQIFLITTVSLVLTFSLNSLFRKINKKIDKKRPSKLHVHHSVAGVLLLAIGIVAGSAAVASTGLGIYLAHGFEEMYFNKRSPAKAFFILITR